MKQYTPLRKSYKWTAKVFLHYFDEAIYNYYIIYQVGGGKKRLVDFKLMVIRGFNQRAGININNENKGSKKQHFLDFVPTEP